MPKNQRVKILVVDDDKEFLEEVQEMLNSCGYKITVVSDGYSVLSMAQALKPDIILLDLKMMPKSGFQIADELRHSLGMTDVRIIAMTGFFNEEKHKIIMKFCGINQCVLKPIKPLDLISKIEFELSKEPGELSVVQN